MEINANKIITSVIGASLVGIFTLLFNINNAVITNTNDIGTIQKEVEQIDGIQNKQTAHAAQITQIAEKVDKPVYSIDQEMTTFRFDSKKDDIKELNTEIVKLEIKLEEIEDAIRAIQ